MSQKTSYRVAQLLPSQAKSSCIAIGIYQSNKLTPAATELDKASGGYLKKFLRQGDFTGKSGQSSVLYDLPEVQAKRVLLIGCGNHKKSSLSSYHAAHKTFIDQVTRLHLADATSFLSEIASSTEECDPEWAARQAVITCENALYRFNQCKSQVKKDDGHNLSSITLAQISADTVKPASKAAKQGQAIADGMSLAKTLGNLPGNICTPDYLANQARGLQKKYEAIKTTVLTEAAMKKLGMGSLLSVASGSQHPARLVVMEYKQGKKSDNPVVLVGKGVTFDSGGISLKPGLKMDEMKFDMCGAASVLGTIQACAQMKLKANVIGVLACAENMPGGEATKPGDIITSMSGKTIEILNTDAEGRLVLCDALSYVERYHPAAVIDIATLTGACIVALGRHPSAILGNNETLISNLKQAGEVSDDRVWQLPLWPEYKKQLKSNFADLANIGGPDGGTITAAAFLSHFTESYPWAHLDIAGTAWKTEAAKGATGRPVSLLTHYIIQQHT